VSSPFEQKRLALVRRSRWPLLLSSLALVLAPLFVIQAGFGLAPGLAFLMPCLLFAGIMGLAFSQPNPITKDEAAQVSANAEGLFIDGTLALAGEQVRASPLASTMIHLFGWWRGAPRWSLRPKRRKRARAEEAHRVHRETARLA